MHFLLYIHISTVSLFFRIAWWDKCKIQKIYKELERNIRPHKEILTLFSIMLLLVPLCSFMCNFEIKVSDNGYPIIPS